MCVDMLSAFIMKSNQNNVSPLERLKEILSDTSGIAGFPEERAEWKKYFEDQNELAKEVASQIETEKDKMADQKKSTWLGKIKDVLRKILTDTHGECNIPDNVIRDLAKALLPNILAFFESADGKREFDEWKKQQEKEKEKDIPSENL